MTHRLKETTLLEFSDRVVRLAGFPPGTAVALFRKDSGRRVRSDFVLKRQPLVAKSFVKPAPGDGVGEFLAALRELLSTDIEERGLELRLLGPQDQWLDERTRIGVVWMLAVEADEQPAPTDSMSLFEMLLENAHLDDELSPGAARRLYRELVSTLGPEFENLLERKNNQIRLRNIPR